MRRLTYPTGVNLVVVVFQIVRVLIHIRRVIRFDRVIREVVRGTTSRARELALKGRIVSVRGVVLDVPSLLGSFCLLTAAPHGVNPFCTWTWGGQLWRSVRPRNVWSICRIPRLHAFGGICLPRGPREAAAASFSATIRGSQRFFVRSRL